MLPPIDEPGGWLATGLAMISGGLLIGWRAWLRMRKDLRDDHTEGRTTSGVDLVDSTYRLVISGLRERIDSIARDHDELYTDFRMERAGRMEAEERAVNCERKYEALLLRVSALEIRLNGK